MLSNKTLQTKLFTSVFIVVSLTVISITGLASWIEKNRFQQAELRRIYFATDSMKKRLGHLIYGNNLRSLVIALTNAKNSDPSILYFLLSDINGRIMIADKQDLIGKTSFDAVTRIDGQAPLPVKGVLPMDAVESGKFRIYLSRLNQDMGDPDMGSIDSLDPKIQDRERFRGKSREAIFDVFCDIYYMNEKMGTLRVGFSRHRLKEHLYVVTGIILGTGFLVLGVVLFIIYLVIRRQMAPLGALSVQLSKLSRTREGVGLRQSLENLVLEENPTEVREIRNLKQGFGHICGLFITSWDQLEAHRHNLEHMVDERTAELNSANVQLTRQIRERKEIESRLLTVQKLEAVGTLAGGVAHEFNNLFMAITGYATLIQKQAEPGNVIIEKAEKIRELVDKGSLSIQQLLGFARSGKYDPGPLNINEIVRVGLFIFSPSRKELEIDVNYAPDVWAVYADRSQMEQVIMNLLLNASEAMPEKGCLRVETRNVVLDKKPVALEKVVSGKFVVLTVSDTGHGIDKDILPRIFDPFFTTREMGLGSGMGLASVFGIVENHGGFTLVKSQKGEGASFFIYLPAFLDHPS